MFSFGVVVVIMVYHIVEKCFVGRKQCVWYLHMLVAFSREAREINTSVRTTYTKYAYM